MSDYNLSWFKMDLNFIGNKKIKLLRKYPEGDSLVIFYFALICEGMKSQDPGKIIIDDYYKIDEYFSDIFDISIKTIQLGLTLFEKPFKFIEIIKNTVIIKKLKEYQALDLIEYKKEKNRIKVAKFRQKQKELASNDVTVTGLPVTNIEDKIIGEEIKEENKKLEPVQYHFNKWLSIINSKYTIFTLKPGTERNELYTKYIKSDYFQTNKKEIEAE